MKTIYQTRLAIILLILTFLTRFSGLAQAPTITNVSPMSGTIGTLITITGSNFNNGTIVQIGSTFAIVVATTPSELKAMVMPQSTSNIITVTAANGVVSTTVPFVVETRDEPNLQVETKKVGTGAVASSEQGNAVAISADGNTAIVGGRGDAGFFGAAWIYVKQGNSWVQQGNKLVGTGTVGGFTQQGYSVALSADGNTAAIGGVGDNSGIGAVWVFVRTGSTWSQQGAKLVGSDAVNFSNRGYSLSMSADGNTIVTGAPGFNSEIGSAFVFVRNGNIWTQQGTMIQGTGAAFSPRFGESVSISANGNTIAIGGPKDNSSRGAVWIFTRSGGIWSQQGLKLVGTQSLSGSQFGISLSLSADGNTVLVGGWQDGAGGALGASWVFVRSGGVWSQQGNKLIGTGFSWPTYQGRSVSLSADGNLAMIGGFLDNSGAGAVWFFKRSGTTWTQSGSKMVGAGATGAANQGTSLALSADGLSAIVGGPLDNSSIGAAWFFASPLPPPSISSFSPQIGSVGTPIRITGNRLNEVTAASVGGVPALLLSSSSTELVVMAMPGSTTGLLNLTTPGGNASSTTNFTVEASRTPDVQQGGKIKPIGGLGMPIFGYSVALSADGNTAIIGGVGDNAFEGAAWIFIRNNGIWEQQGPKLFGSGGVGARQGFSVAISADGNTAAVGGYTDNNNQGAAWIFTRSGTNWTQQGSKLVGTGNVGAAYQGSAVSLSANGNTLIVGGRFDNANQGAAWVFVRNNGTWSQQGAKLFGTGVTGNAFQGTSVAISAEGNTVAIGGTQDNLGIGATWVFTRSNGVWSQQGAKLVGSTAFTNNQQGISISLSADGNTLAVGGIGYNAFNGATWIFTRSAGTWSQQGNPLTGFGNLDGAYQGNGVALSADGNTLAVGGHRDEFSKGAIWMFNRSGTSWTQFGSKLQGSGSVGTSYQGYYVALSADGNTMLTGGYGDSSLQGAAWVFTSSLALPLTLLDFKVKLIQNQHARLSWETSFEEDVSHFELQQSADGRAFATIGKVKAKGIGGQRTSYQYEQPNLSNGKHYFKLKMVDIDGKFTFSKTVMVHVGTHKGVKIFPNPASEWVELEGNNIQQVTIYNQLGMKCLDRKYAGQGNVRLQLQHVLPGIYTIVVVDGSRQIHQEQLIIKH